MRARLSESTPFPLSWTSIVSYAQELVPGRVGLVSGMMFGLMFGISGIGAAGMGDLADRFGIIWVFGITAYLPLLGFATALLPSTRGRPTA
jgi:FSR family fosmidomycin resistance protein-like MFS transporter